MKQNTKQHIIHLLEEDGHYACNKACKIKASKLTRDFNEITCENCLRIIRKRTAEQTLKDIDRIRNAKVETYETDITKIIKINKPAIIICIVASILFIFGLIDIFNGKTYDLSFFGRSSFTIMMFLYAVIFLISSDSIFEFKETAYEKSCKTCRHCDKQQGIDELNHNIIKTCYFCDVWYDMFLENYVACERFKLDK